MLNSEIVAAYRDARASARRMGTLRLRRAERRARRHAVRRRRDEAAAARLSALRDELRLRGRALPPVPRR